MSRVLNRGPWRPDLGTQLPRGPNPATQMAGLVTQLPNPALRTTSIGDLVPLIGYLTNHRPSSH